MDPDAAAYITAVETADGQALEEKVKIAIDNFVLGCKADGIWSAIKASCILAGARTTNGALVPLVGDPPTPYNFDLAGDTDYDRETGLKGDGSTKYLDSNRANNADPLNNVHLASYITVTQTIGASVIGENIAGTAVLNGATRCRNSTAVSYAVTPSNGGFVGLSRATSANYTNRANSITLDVVQASVGSDTTPYFLFARSSPSPGLYSNPRLAFYSIGESLDLARLDARVTDLINAIGVAIP
jgi:hypothetical protein